MLAASEAPRHPFVFGSPGRTRPDACTDGRAGERQVRAGLAEITAVRLRVPTADTSSDALRSLQDAASSCWRLPTPTSPG